jgi:LysR substrate binding domain/Pyridine nucleotide-disulphide oxidoreductase, dimerisation domain
VSKRRRSASAQGGLPDHRRGAAPPALRAFRRAWLRVEVILSENDRLERLTEQLARGALDLAFARDASSDDRVEAIPRIDDPPTKAATYTRAYAESNGFLTLLSSGERLTAASALGPEAGEWLQQATLAIRARVGLEVLRDTIQPFPTLSETYVAALKALDGEITAARQPIGQENAAVPSTEADNARKWIPSHHALIAETRIRTNGTSAGPPQRVMARSPHARIAEDARRTTSTSSSAIGRMVPGWLPLLETRASPPAPRRCPLGRNAAAVPPWLAAS